MKVWYLTANVQGKTYDIGALSTDMAQMVAMFGPQNSCWRVQEEAIGWVKAVFFKRPPTRRRTL